MTRFEYLTASIERLADFFDVLQSDGLQAKGCSLDLQLPPNEEGSWIEWLVHDYPDDFDNADRAAEIEEMDRTVFRAAASRG